MITLGKKVKDMFNGFTGIAVGRAEYVNAGSKILVSPLELNNGLPMADQWVDEMRLEQVQSDKDMHAFGFRKRS